MPDSRDLCGLADVKALMQKTGPNAAAQDELISTLITRASIKIMRDYGREFVPGGVNKENAVAATRTFEFPWSEMATGEARVSLRPYDLAIQDPSSVTVVADPFEASPYTLSTAEFRLWPQPPTQGVYLSINLLPLNMSVGIIGWRKRYVTVTGNWGFPSVPFEVTQACAATVVHWITSYPAARRVDQVDMNATVFTPRSYPMSALDDLNAFKRMDV